MFASAHSFLKAPSPQHYRTNASETPTSTDTSITNAATSHLKRFFSPSLLRSQFLQLTGSVISSALASNPSACADPRPVAQTAATKPANNSVCTARVIVSTSETAGRLPPRTVGLSYEKGKLSTDFFKPTNTILIACLTGLGSGILRLGGGTVDRVSWAPNGVGGVQGQVAPSDITSLALFIREVRWSIIYGINLATNTPASAAEEAAFATQAFGDYLFGFEIGNECDIYSRNGLRAKQYTFQDFIVEWNAYFSTIRHVLPAASFCGPASSASLKSWTVPFASKEAPNIKLLTQHYYRGDGSASTSTINKLLTKDDILEADLSLLESAADSHLISGSYRLAEVNSYYGGGTVNVSNTYSSALWAIDLMLIGAQRGSAGVNFHGGGLGLYTAIADKDNSVTAIRPLYYGLLYASQIPPGSMCKVNTVTPIDLSAYTIVVSDGVNYIAILNKDATTCAITNIDLGKMVTKATAIRLNGPRLDALAGVTLGGAAVKEDGTWSKHVEEEIAVTGGTMSVRVEAATAILIKAYTPS